MKGMIDVPEGTDIINVRKSMNNLFKEARKNARPKTCILCGKSNTGFCNSHSVPQMSLSNIADNGKILQASALLGIEAIDFEKGVNNSGTFHFICRECDGTFFQDYENESNLLRPPTDKMLAEIAVKNFLLQLSKRGIEEEVAKELQKQFAAFENLQDILEIKELDVQDYQEELEFHKKIVDKGLTDGYQVLFWKVLPYRVPIAMQSAIALDKDMNGKIINDIYDMSPSTKMQYMHLAILPLKRESVVLSFYHKKDKLYRNLRHQINSSSEQKVLQFLNYLIFEHTENIFISKTVQTEIETNDKLALIMRESNQNPMLGHLSADNLFGIGYQPVRMDEIPNFLSIEWAVPASQGMPSPGN